jgi:hypothetical protein
VIVADTGAIVALIDADDRHHGRLRTLFEARPDAWVLPWAILPEVDYLLAAHVGARAEEAFLDDLAAGRWLVAWGDEADLARARELARRHRRLDLGLVDTVVMAVAERLGAEAIATLDERDFAAVKLVRPIPLWPRDAA